MDLIIFLVIFIGVPVLYLLLMLYRRLNQNHRPRRRNVDRELQHRDWHAGWFYPGDTGGGGDSGGGGGGPS